jgi:hypothetical protein
VFVLWGRLESFYLGSFAGVETHVGIFVETNNGKDEKNIFLFLTMQFGFMADVAMEKEGEATGGRVAAAHLVCLCCGGGWKLLP